MIGTSLGEWVFIRLSIAFFRYTPFLYLVSFVTFLLFAPGNNTWGYFGLVTSAISLLAESIFFVTIWRPYLRQLTDPAVHPAKPSRDERKALFHRCFDNVDNTEAYLRGWFLGAELSDIRRDNVREFLLWAFFDCGDDMPGTQDASELQDVEDFIRRIEFDIGRRLEPGRGSVQSLRLTLDEIMTTYRSLLWYIVIFAVDQLTHTLLMWKGFRYYAGTCESVFPPRPQRFLSRHRSPVSTLGYWYSPHTSRKRLPLLFFHGIGVGLLVYIGYLAALLKTDKDADGEIGIIAIELLPISFRLTTPPPSKAEFIQKMTQILDYHKWDTFALASHSYGSVLVTHMLSFPALDERVRAVVLIDPVTIMLHLPDVAFNFTRRAPKEANQWQLWYFASTDPGVAYCLGRHFFWRQNIVWRDDLVGLKKKSEEMLVARKVAVSLSGRDLITRPGVIAQYLETDNKLGGEVDVIVFHHLDHAQVFDAPNERKQVVDLTRSCLLVRSCGRKPS